MPWHLAHVGYCEIIKRESEQNCYSLSAYEANNLRVEAGQMW